jgi:hypothetical protein
MPKMARPAPTMENLGKEPMSLLKFSNQLLLTIDQISHLTGVRKSTLRYWEKSFHSILKPSRTRSNRREYSLEDLNRIKTIKLLLEKEHLTSRGVRLRLVELFPPKQEGDRGRQAKKAGQVGRNPSH